HERYQTRWSCLIPLWQGKGAVKNSGDPEQSLVEVSERSSMSVYIDLIRKTPPQAEMSRGILADGIRKGRVTREVGGVHHQALFYRPQGNAIQKMPEFLFNSSSCGETAGF